MSLYSDLVVNDGAIASWRLNETSGTTAVDRIGAKNGTISGGVTLNQPGAIFDGDKAMAFNGTTGKIATTYAGYPATVTVEAWVRTASMIQMPVVSNREFNLAGDVYFGLSGGGVFCFASASLGGGSGLANNQWHHIVMVSDGTTTTLYADGVQVAQGAQNRPAVARVVNFGFDTPNAVYWSGSIDEVAIYPLALTADQIAAHYRAAFASAFRDAVIADNPFTYCQYEETGGTWARDVFGGSPTGGLAISATGVTLNQPGRIGRAFAFVSPGTVTLTTEGLGFAAFTVECWAKVVDGSAVNRLFWMRDSLSTTLWQLNTDPGDLLLWRVYSNTALNEFTQVVASSVAVEGAWAHVVATFDPTVMRLYVNGVEVGNKPTGFAWLDAAGQVTFGTTSASPGTGLYLDEMVLYDHALTAAQVGNHYTAATGGAGGWPDVPWWMTEDMDMGTFNRWTTVTPSDTVDLAVPCEAVWVGGAGNVAFVAGGTSAAVTFVAVPAGSWLPIKARRINAAGTTATNIVALNSV